MSFEPDILHEGVSFLIDRSSHVENVSGIDESGEGLQEESASPNRNSTDVQPSITKVKPLEGFNSEEGHGKSKIGSLLARAHEREFTLPKSSKRKTSPKQKTCNMFEVLHKSTDLTSLYPVKHAPLSYMNKAKYSHLFPESIDREATAIANREQTRARLYTLDEVEAPKHDSSKDSHRISPNNGQDTIPTQPQKSHNKSQSKYDSLDRHSSRPEVFPIPQLIQDIVTIIKACERNKQNLPVRRALHEALPEDFTLNRSHIKKNSPLLEWSGDTRLFTEEWWNYLTFKGS